jgi:hypothetical protein
VVIFLSLPLITGDSHAASVSLTSVSPSVSSWAKTYGGLGGSGAQSVDRTSDGGYIVAGYTNATSWVAPGSSQGGYDSDGWLLKLDASGNVQWQKSYRTPGIDALYKVKQTSDGGFVAVGLTRLANWGDVNAWVLRVDSQGNVVWDNSYGGSQTEQANDVIQTVDGGFLVVGFAYSFGGLPAWVLRLDSGGGILWQKAYNSTLGDSDASSVVATSDGGFVIAGEYRSDITSSQTYSELWLFKINGDGALDWQKAYAGAGKGDIGYSLYQTSDQGFVVAGFTTSYGAAWAAVWVLKLDSQGDVVWQKAYGGGGMAMFHEAYSVVQLSDGSFVVAGFSFDQFSPGQTGTGLVLRLDSSGSVIWSRTYGPGQVWQTVASSDGGILLVGSTSQMVMVVKLDSSSVVGPGCALEGSFNSTTVDSTMVPVSTGDTSFTTTAKVFPVDAVAIDTSATVSVPCSYLLMTLAASPSASIVRALNSAVLRIHASSENSAVAEANVTVGSSGPGNFSRTAGLTDAGGNFTFLYGSPQVSAATTVIVNVTVFKQGYVTAQKLVMLTVNPALPAVSVPPPLILWPYLATLVVVLAALVPAAYFITSRKRPRTKIEPGRSQPHAHTGELAARKDRGAERIEVLFPNISLSLTFFSVTIFFLLTKT